MGKLYGDLVVPEFTLLKGDCLETLKDLPDNSIDAVLCDPPYHLQSIQKRFSSEDASPVPEHRGALHRLTKGFMGKTWDGGDIAFRTDVWRECYRVLKPGGHLVAFGGTRTIHRITCAIEDSGLEIRDLISWLFFSGFPKSHNISKAIDRSEGAEREIIGTRKQNGSKFKLTEMIMDNGGFNDPNRTEYVETIPKTADAIKWQGWGTALKPAQEPACLARKPIEKGLSIADNVRKWGTGALNIDKSRFQYGDPCWVGPQEAAKPHGKIRDIRAPFESFKDQGHHLVEPPEPHILGRWPANIYQCAKPSRAEKEQGLEHLEPTTGAEAVGRTEGSAGLDNPRAGAGRTAAEIRNIHPTVKPLKLMRWLVRLVTPEGGTVLDPFAGSGTTLCAAMLENRHSIGCELTAEYLPIIHGRVQWAIDEYYKENQQLILPW